MNNLEKTFGMKCVNIDFNPSGDEKVYKAKKLCADLIDMVEEKREYDLKQTGSNLNTKESEMFRWSSSVFRTAAFNAIIAAQMGVVKFLTWKE